MTAQLWLAFAGIAITALGSLVATVFTTVGNRKASAAATQVEHRKVDRAEYDAYVDGIRSDLARKDDEIEGLRERLAEEDARSTALREQLRAGLDEINVISRELHKVRAELEEERQVTEPMRARIAYLEIQVEHLRARLRDAGLDT